MLCHVLAGAGWAKATLPEIDTSLLSDCQGRPFALHSGAMATAESKGLLARAKGDVLAGKNKQVALGKLP